MKFKRSMVLISSDPRSIRLGAEAVFHQFQQELSNFGLEDEVALSQFSESDRSDALPMVIIYPEANAYGPVQATDVKRIVEEHLYKGRMVEDLLAPKKEISGQVDWLKNRKGALPMEHRIITRRIGRIDPENIEDYIAEDGYQALAQVLRMTPAQIIETLEESGLQGRGGAGFPTGRKWRFVAAAHSPKKYVVCNADESEPGTFKDRVIMEGDPHSIIEAMTIAGYAIGADEGYIYVRGEYKLVQKRLQHAIEQATAFGLLGQNIMNTGFNFKIHIHSGAGAYVCGEETALLESIEGKRGEPRARPPYPTTHGLWGKPTLINNVETLANVPPIILNGATWYRAWGTPSSPGTKCYTIMGNVNFRGLIEVPMGITLREVIAIYGQGMKDGAAIKLAQTGGSSGAIIPASLQDTPMDFESFKKAGVSLGSGALLICDERTCVVDLVYTLAKFFKFESCGKCTPCRFGTQHIYNTVERITRAEASMDELEQIAAIVSEMERLSNCGLGQTAGTPFRSMMEHFREEVEAHVIHKICPAGICTMTPEPVLE